MLFFGVITESLALLSDYYHYSYHHACFDYFAYCGSGLTHYEYEDLIPAFFTAFFANLVAVLTASFLVILDIVLSPLMNENR